MKIHRKILFRIIFLLAVLFCYGINVYSNYNVHSYSIEQTAGTNTVENSLSSDIDSSNEDQNNQFDEFDCIGKPIFQIPNTNNYFSTYNFCFSVWQPPKNS